MVERFRFQAPATDIVFGVGSAAQLGKHATRLGLRRALLVTDAALAQSDACRAAVESLQIAGVSVELYADVVLDPTDDSVEWAAEHYRAVGADGLVALGGGSAMDTAKALGVLVASDARAIAPFFFGGSATPVGIPPLICLPTTAGTGSEVTYVAIVTERESQQKMLVRHPAIAPTVAIIDPKLSVTMPPALTAYTGMDALSHALEAMTSTLATPLSDSLALDAIPRIVAALPRAVEAGDDLEARAEMSYAALAAGLAFLNGRVHLGHAVGHSLGTAYHLPHGLACIVCMPAIMGLLHKACGPQLARIAAAFDVDAGDLPQALKAFMERCRVPRLGAALQTDASIVPSLVELVQTEQRLIALAPRQPSADEWAEMFTRSL